MGLIESIKTAIRRQGKLYAPIRAWRAKRKDAEYTSLREQYFGRGGKVFALPGYLERSAALLRNRWPGPFPGKKSLAEVRLFIIDKPSLIGAWFLSEFCRVTNAAVFNITRHQIEFSEKSPREAGWAQSFSEEDRFLNQPAIAEFGNWRAKFQADLLQAVAQAHEENPLDLVFAYGSYKEFQPETLQSIRSMGIPVALLWLDDRHTYLGNPKSIIPSGQKPLIGSCDVHLTNSLECVRWYLGEGVPALYFPTGVDPEVFRPRHSQKDIPVSFVGGAYGMRGNFIRTLKTAGIPVQCFGRGWESGPVKDNVEIYSKSLISLGFGGVSFSDRIFCVKGRDMEIPASGTLYLTTYNPELAELFYIGKEIHCYHNEIDCVELIRYFLERPEEARGIGQAGRGRCLKEHTWSHRLSFLLQWMGFMDQSSL
jgi:spore maturation protein CgeB